MDLLWLIFIGVCAGVGIILTLWWIRVQASEDRELEDLEQQARRLARRQARRGVPPTPRRPPPPTPDLVSVRDAWIEREDTEETAPPIALRNLQGSETPTAPSGPRAGTQGAVFSRGPARTRSVPVSDEEPERTP